MFATEVLHFLVDSVQHGLSDTNRQEMHAAITDVEKLWRDVHPASAPPEPQPEPAAADAEAAAAKDAEIADLKAQNAKIEAQLAALQGG